MKSKKERYSVIAKRDSVLQRGKPLYNVIKDNWKAVYFKNQNPIILELACGYGEYTTGMAEQFPDRNFVGMDVKGARLWKGSTVAMERNLTNVAFLRASILDIETFFGKDEIHELWITFPDPRPKRRDIKRRLTHPRFLECYKKILTHQGLIRLKTDAIDLFNYTLDELHRRTDINDLKITYDLYASPFLLECHDIQTRYEKRFLAQDKAIKYLRFRFA